MKIVFLCRNFGLVNRGAETYSDELSKQLRRLGHAVSIHKNIFDSIDPKTDVVITTNGRLDAILTKIWCMLNGAKLIIPGQSGLGWDDRLNLWLSPNAFVALSEHQKKWAKKVNPLARVETIPNGVDLQMFNSNVKPIETGLKHPIILNVGVVDSFKRQHLLKKASPFSVLLVGEGGDIQVDHRKMPSVYTACDLFSYPTSANESFGIVMLEAMASGLPVVATDDPIRREIVGDAGLFVDPTDTANYAEKLKDAMKINWGNKPRLQAEKFSWERIAKDYEKLFS